MATSQEYGLGEFRFARGWFAVAESRQVHNAPFNVHYFGQDMVLYRGQSGRVVMLDAYCPHMGTHIGKCEGSATVQNGTFLEGDSIRCPFHAWRFGPDGRCDDIPYHDGPIPSQAQLKSWPVEERWGIVFCWHDPESRQPDFPLPELPEWDDKSFVRWPGFDPVGDLNHPIEVFDNMSDGPHLEHLHGGGKLLAYENEVEGHLYHQRETMGEGFNATAESKQVLGKQSAADAEQQTAGKLLTTVGAYHGPGLMLSRFYEANGIQLLCTTPIDDGSCRVLSAAMMRSPSNGADPAADEEMRSRFAGFLVDGLRKDGEVWAHKKPAIKIMQITSDGPFARGRGWYGQFFNPRENSLDLLSAITGKHYVRGVSPWTGSEFDDEAVG